MPDESAPVSTYQDATLSAVKSLTEELGHYPAPVDVATKLGISRQTLYQRVNVLAQSGLIERLNHGHALRVLQTAARP
jgi:Mn-dependent DtxR family transcriptional regulator